MEETPRKRGLFGGAIVAEFPETYIDASDLREIPDHQEVFVSRVSNNSIILEVLKAAEQQDPVEAAKIHFANLAHDNDALSSSVCSTQARCSLHESTPSHVLLTGTQEITKFNRLAPDKVLILFAVYTIVHKGVDLVLSANIPLHRGTAEMSDVDMVSEKSEETKEFANIAASVEILDYGLFPDQKGS